MTFKNTIYFFVWGTIKVILTFIFLANKSVKNLDAITVSNFYWVIYRLGRVVTTICVCNIVQLLHKMKYYNCFITFNIKHTKFFCGVPGSIFRHYLLFFSNSNFVELLICNVGKSSFVFHVDRPAGILVCHVCVCVT